MRAHEHGRLPVSCRFIRSMLWLLLVTTVVGYFGLASALGQAAPTCQTLSLQLQSATGDGYVQFGFYIAPASTPTTPLFFDDVIQLYTSGPPQTFDLGQIINLDYGIFPAGSYIITVLESTETPGTVNTGVVQLTLGSGLQFQGGSQTLSVSTSSSNPAGVAIPVTNLAASCSNPYTPASVDLVDPVPLLLEDSHVTDDRPSLASGAQGRVVKGVAADGIAQLVLRIPVQAAGDVVTATLLSNCTTESVPQTCSPSPYAGDDGGFFPIGTSVSASDNLPNQLSDKAQGDTKYAFIAYRAPNDFVRSYGPTTDTQVAERMTYVQLSYASADGTAYAVQFVPLVIVRPPVVLIHGLFSDPSVFNVFAPLAPSDGATNNLFSISTLDYSQPTIEVSGTSPNYLFSNQLPLQTASIKDNTVGVEYNAPQLLDQLVDVIAAFKLGTSPLNIPVAAVRADVVGHSLGGLMARGMTLVGTAYPSRINKYAARTTYSAGYIHKLITLGTPHFGSEYALRILDGTNNCVSGLAAIDGTFNFKSVTIGGKVYSGATGDLAGDSQAGGAPSGTLATLKAVRLPTAFVAGEFTSANSSYRLDVIGRLFRLRCSGSFLADNYSFGGWPLIFNGQPSDAFVSVRSATASYLYNNLRTGVVHGPGTEGIVGFNGPYLLEFASGAPSAALNLLNTNVTDLKFEAGSLP